MAGPWERDQDNHSRLIVTKIRQSYENPEFSEFISFQPWLIIIVTLPFWLETMSPYSRMPHVVLAELRLRSQEVLHPMTAA